MEELAGKELVVALHPAFQLLLCSGVACEPMPLNLLPERELVFEQQDEYALLLEQALAGEHMNFATAEEIHACWLLIDNLEKMRNKIPFVVYKEYTEPEKPSF